MNHSIHASKRMGIGHVTHVPGSSQHWRHKGTALVIGSYVILLNLLLLNFLVTVWPSATPLDPQKSTPVFLLLGKWWPVSIGLETSYLLIVILSGALGSYIHLATSFADYVGNRRLEPSWLWWYILRPFIGMALALVVYFVVRAGLITGGDAQSMSASGVAAIAGMCGLFSKQATDKLRDVFETLFRTRTEVERADALSERPPEH